MIILRRSTGCARQPQAFNFWMSNRAYSICASKPEYVRGHDLPQLKKVVKVSDEVKSTLFDRKIPVIALESCIFGHGLPFPDNLNIALEIERLIRQHNAIPATIGLLNGHAIVGMTKVQIEEMVAAAKIGEVVKSSYRDIPFVLNQKLLGATTVSATMFLAHLAGIDLFVTGGIGGVHRGAEKSFDISSDLVQLSRTPVTVVCSGVKSILDIPLTLEYLETMGVPAITLGQAGFPSFYKQDSKVLSPLSVNSSAELAGIIHHTMCLGMQSGIVAAVPIPHQFDVFGEELDTAVAEAAADAERHHVTGKKATPFILSRVAELSNYQSVKLNKELVLNNATVGCEIAHALLKLKQEKCGKAEGTSCIVSKPDMPEGTKQVTHHTSRHQQLVIVGNAGIDILISTQSEFGLDGATYPGQVSTCLGGVARNITDALSHTGFSPYLLAAVGKDDAGRQVLNNGQHFHHHGILQSDSSRTASCAIFMNSTGDPLCHIIDADILNELTPDLIHRHKSLIQQSPLVVLDCCTPLGTMDALLHLCSEANVPVFVEPTDMKITMKPFSLQYKNTIAYTSPNIEELCELSNGLCGTTEKLTSTELGRVNTCEQFNDMLALCTGICKRVVEHIPNILLTLGSHGVLLCQHSSIDTNAKFLQRLPQTPGRHSSTVNTSVSNKVSSRHFPAASLDAPVVSASGAGDCFAAGVVHGMLHGWHASSCIDLGQRLARCSLLSQHAVPSTIQSVQI